jgi:predicted CoA-binding protein
MEIGRMEIPCLREVGHMSQDIDEVLALKTWAIVGLSNNEFRAAYSVAQILKEKGHRIVPVHPKAEEVHGEKGYASLEEIPFPVDVVDVFVNSSLAGDVVDTAINIGAKAVWLQLNVIDEAAILRAKNAGLLTVMNHCPAIEYGKRGRV